MPGGGRGSARARHGPRQCGREDTLPTHPPDAGPLGRRRRGMSGGHSWGRAPGSPPRPQVRGADPARPGREQGSAAPGRAAGPRGDPQPRSRAGPPPEVLSHRGPGPAPPTLPRLGSARRRHPRPARRPEEAVLASPPHESARRAATTPPGARVSPAARALRPGSSRSLGSRGSPGRAGELAGGREGAADRKRRGRGRARGRCVGSARAGAPRRGVRAPEDGGARPGLTAAGPRRGREHPLPPEPTGADRASWRTARGDPRPEPERRPPPGRVGRLCSAVTGFSEISESGAMVSSLIASVYIFSFVPSHPQGRHLKERQLFSPVTLLRASTTVSCAPETVPCSLAPRDSGEVGEGNNPRGPDGKAPSTVWDLHEENVPSLAPLCLLG